MTTRDSLYEAMFAASKKLKAIAGGGTMGLTPDSVKASPEYKQAKAEYSAAFARVRAFNSLNKQKAVR